MIGEIPTHVVKGIHRRSDVGLLTGLKDIRKKALKD